MKILVFGSLNIDRTYKVKEFVTGGETISARRMDLYCGGKGFNQAIALARAGSGVFFAGAVGDDGKILLDALRENGIDHRFVQTLPCSTGHAVIQVNDAGQNCIVILAGANGEITQAYAEQVLEAFAPGDLIVLQNEISSLDFIIRAAHRKGMLIALNPSPMNEDVLSYPLELVDFLLLNETEGEKLAGTSDTSAMIRKLHGMYPRSTIVLTLGEKGSVLMAEDGTLSTAGIYPVDAVDTTAAGDTFTGYFLSEYLRGGDAAEALRIAAVAAGLSVMRQGAEPSIPGIAEVRAASEANAAKDP